jgi:hypothetical protein
MGPGNGTLMKDILRTIKRYPDFVAAARICLIELSGDLIRKQQEALGVRADTVVDRASEEGWIRGTAELTSSSSSSAVSGAQRSTATEAESIKIPVTWYRFLRLVPFGVKEFSLDGRKLQDTFNKISDLKQQQQQAELGKSSTTAATKEYARTGSKEAGEVHQQEGETEPVLIIGQEFLDAFPVHQFIRSDVSCNVMLGNASSADACCYRTVGARS